MILKNFYLNNNSIFETVNDKKFCIKNIYGKFLIRSNIFKNKKLLFLDNGENFFHIKEKTIHSRLNFSFEKNILGHSFRVKNNIYTNQQNRSLKFKYFSFYNYKKNPLSKLNNFFYSLKKKKRIPLIFIQSIKGGFLCYLYGAICFVANYQINRYIERQRIFFSDTSNFLSILKNFFFYTNFIYYPWYLSRFKLQINYNKKRKLKNPKRKFYILRFSLISSNNRINKKPFLKKLKKPIFSKKKKYYNKNENT